MNHALPQLPSTISVTCTGRGVWQHPLRSPRKAAASGRGRRRATWWRASLPDDAEVENDVGEGKAQSRPPSCGSPARARVNPAAPVAERCGGRRDSGSVTGAWTPRDGTDTRAGFSDGFASCRRLLLITPCFTLPFPAHGQAPRAPFTPGECCREVDLKHRFLT